MTDYRSLGADRPPFRVGETVVVLISEHAATNPTTGPTKWYGNADIQNVNRSGTVLLLDGMVLTAPGPVGKGRNDETPGYSVSLTMPNGTVTAMSVSKDSIYRVQDRPLLQAVLNAQDIYSSLSAAQQLEVQGIYAKHSPGIMTAQKAHRATVAALRDATMPKLRPMPPHAFVKSPKIWVTRCTRPHCGLEVTDPIHALKGVKP
jgi:hypothetical protein